MLVRELIELLRRFDPDDEVHIGVNSPGRVASVYQRLWVGSYGGGPQINAVADPGRLEHYAGLDLRHLVFHLPGPAVDLGDYETDEIARKVRDFYVFHRRLNEPLHYPDFDYERWIPPRTRSGQYNPHIAAILEEKLLED